MKDKGYIQIYTGSGKGKTTAAMGLALRAAGAGFKVFIGQFMKSGKYSELKAIEMLSPYIEIRQFGSGSFVFGNPTDEDRRLAKTGVDTCRVKMASGDYDLIIMDEINVAHNIGLVSTEDIISLMKEKPEKVELIMTGRGATQEMIELADLVTEMKEIKHYYKSGVDARTGIEK